VNVDEVTMMDNQLWIHVNIYFMKDWHHIPILLTLEHVEVGANANDIIAILLKCMVKY
jgi:hypothetical protein